jgi:hypothetical protein
MYRAHLVSNSQLFFLKYLTCDKKILEGFCFVPSPCMLVR